MSAKPCRVLVCGGRDFRPWSPVSRALRTILDDLIDDGRQADMVVAQGGANGADASARQWCAVSGTKCVTFHADWSLGLKAGPLRNARMLAEFKPEVVLAFPGGRGTADMVRRARDAGVPVQFPATDDPS